MLSSHTSWVLPMATPSLSPRMPGPRTRSLGWSLKAHHPGINGVVSGRENLHRKTLEWFWTKKKWFPADVSLSWGQVFVGFENLETVQEMEISWTLVVINDFWCQKKVSKFSKSESNNVIYPCFDKWKYGCIPRSIIVSWSEMSKHVVKDVDFQKNNAVS
jgi:hypothetical protein